MIQIDTAFSSCPNDTFIFNAMVHGLVDTGDFGFNPYIADVEELNQAAFGGTYRLTKLSFHAYLLLKNRYRLLDAGAALGYGCGPLLVARSGSLDVTKARVAIPGEFTTAYLLLRLWQPHVGAVTVTRFDNILDGVASGQFDAGLIIHEGRFVYPEYGLVSIVDLGEWWEKKTGMPIPLGCIALRGDASDSERNRINDILRSSIEYAFSYPEAGKDYIRRYAREMDDHVIQEHINLYVNSYSIDLGENGREAVRILEDMAQQAGILP